MRENLILQTDSYKLTHAEMLPAGTTGIFSYLEAREGGDYPRTLWFGLQYYLKRYLEGVRVTVEDIEEAHNLCAGHFAKQRLNADGWLRIVRVHGGRLPVRICAASEGATIPCGNVLMTIENTDPKLPWLTNAIESLLLKVWYPTTVATRSRYLRRTLQYALDQTGGGLVDYMLHDFGYRGASSEETAGLGGMAHLLSFNGTDTLPAIRMAREYYGAPVDVAASVPASEHSVMTGAGKDGEIATALRIIAEHEGQIVSLVADSYDYYRFVDAMIDNQSIVNRYRVDLVLRPDSVTPQHTTPEVLVLWTLARIKERLTSAQNERGYTVLPYKVLWGDGIDQAGIVKIVTMATDHGFAASNLVFGMGGGLLQKVNRDTCRFAIKCSARRDAHGVWHDQVKNPLDSSKQSKGGRLILCSEHRDVWDTRTEGNGFDCLQPVFENGVILKQALFGDIRTRARA